MLNTNSTSNNTTTSDTGTSSPSSESSRDGNLPVIIKYPTVYDKVSKSWVSW